MAVPIEVTISNGGFEDMTKEGLALPILQAVPSENDGYISATTISFTHNTSSADTIDDTGDDFVNANFDDCDLEYILVESTSGVNDGLYLLATDASGQLVMHTDVKLVTETAEHAGLVTLNCVPIFRIVPTRPMSKGVIIFTEGVIGTGDSGMIPCLLNGTHWAAKNGVFTAFTPTPTTDRTYYMWIETAPYVQADGSLWFFLKTAPGGTADGVYSDHLPAVGYLQLP